MANTYMPLNAIKNPRVQSVFTHAEFADFRDGIRNELVSNLAQVRRTRQSNRNSNQGPDAYIQRLLESFASLKEECADGPALV